MKLKLKKRKVYKKGGDFYHPLLIRKYLQNGGDYVFDTADSPNSMTIQGTDNYSTGNYANKNKINFGKVTDTISTGATMLGNVIGTAGMNKDGTVDKGAFTGGEVLKGVGMGTQLGSALGPWGTLIGGAVGAIGGGIYGAVTADQKNAEVNAQLRAQGERERQRQQQVAQTILADYPTSGVIGNEYYQKYGGMMPYNLGGQMELAQGIPPVLNGGQMNATSNNTATAQGNTHEQGGINLPNAEIEHNEALRSTGDGNVQVYSDELHYKPGITFAKQADSISKKKGNLEKNLNSTSIFVKNSAQRQIQNLDNELKTLYETQEAQKAAKGIGQNQKMQFGGDYNESYASPLEKALPYVDNAVNAILTQKTPDIPKPIYDESLPLKTNYNIRPQVIESQRQLASLQDTLERTTGGGGDFRTNVIAANLANTSNVNQLMGQKENVETQLINQNRMNQQQINTANIAKENQYNLNKMHRLDDIHQRISQNVANLSTDAQMQVAQQNQYKKDLAELELLKLRYKETGVYDRNVESVMSDFLGGKTSGKDFVKTMAKMGKGAKELAERIAKQHKALAGKTKAEKGRAAQKFNEEQEILKQTILLGDEMIVPPDKVYNPSAIRPNTLNAISQYEQLKRQRQGLPPYLGKGIEIPSYLPFPQ